jgi:hypothetical protein
VAPAAADTCSGDYSLEALADGKYVGSVDVFAREAKLEPMGDR